jgi:hypothetical protein
MTDTNEVALRFLDKQSRLGAIDVNGKSISITFVPVVQPDGFNCKDKYSCQVANDWNISNPIAFQAKTPKGLIGMLKRHKYNLVPFCK